MKQHYNTIGTWLNKKWPNSERAYCSDQPLHDKGLRFICFVLCGASQDESKTR